MERVIAVRCEDTPHGRELIGYVAREKNRKMVWVVLVPETGKEDVLKLVELHEETRSRGITSQGRLT